MLFTGQSLPDGRPYVSGSAASQTCSQTSNTVSITSTVTSTSGYTGGRIAASYNIPTDKHYFLVRAIIDKSYRLI